MPALVALRDVPLGTPVQEIERAAKAFGVDANFMKAVAKIESDFNPRERTGSYIGLFQLSKSEFSEYGSGDILNPRDNAMPAPTGSYKADELTDSCDPRCSLLRYARENWPLSLLINLCERYHGASPADGHPVRNPF
jgi:hypothetical protein